MGRERGRTNEQTIISSLRSRGLHYEMRHRYHVRGLTGGMQAGASFVQSGKRMKGITEGRDDRRQWDQQTQFS